MSRKTLIFSIVALLAVILSACSPAAATPEATATQAAGVPQEATATQAVGVPQEATATQAVAESTPLPAGSVQLNGAGATFPLPLYTEWTYAYQYVDPSVAINYQGTGSGGGKKAIIDGTVDFAGSDSLLKEEEYASGKDLQMIPAVAGAVVPIYNIQFENLAEGEKPAVLVLDRQTLVDIFNAKITEWNDPAIVALNPELDGKLPAAAITAVHRSDGSGTTELFTKALASFSADWTAGAGSSIEWPVDKAGNGVGGKGNPGVAAAVISTPNSIGYVELSYAIANNIAFASLINKAGSTVVANGDTLKAAMGDFSDSFTDQLTNTIVDAPGAQSWPISGYTYLIIHMENMTDCVKAQKLLEYIQWTLTDPAAGKKAADLGYAVLPDAVRDTVLAKLGEVTCSGNPVLSK